MADWLQQEMNRRYHEVSQLFPLMQGEEFEQLKADIAANGLREAIWLHPDGSIIDGRNRHRACIETEIRPEFRAWNGGGSLVGFVISMNLHRRHLTSSQRAAIALDVLPLLEEEARKRQAHGQTAPGKTLPQNLAEASGEAREQAAILLNTNRQYVSDAKKLKQEAPEIFEQVRAGELSIPEAKRATSNNHTMRVMGSSKSPEWYTPKHIIKLVVDLFGEIDLDPCSNSHESPNVPAKKHYTKEDDGLSQPWGGRVYLNPPYGNEISAWVEALVKKFESGEIQEAIALLPGRIDTQWFQPLYDYLICNIRGRLQFVGAPHCAPFPSVIVYLGEEHDEDFINVFHTLGPIVQRIA